MTYSQAELQQIRNSIKRALNEDLNVKERYAFLKNIRIIDEELDLLRDRLEDDVEGYEDYRKRSFQIMVDCGAKVQPQPDGTQRITSTEDIDQEKFEKEIEKLNEEFKEVIEKQTEVNQENYKKMSEKIAQVDWFTIKFEDVSTSKDSVLNENTLHLIEE